MDDTPMESQHDFQQHTYRPGNGADQLTVGYGLSETILPMDQLVGRGIPTNLVETHDTGFLNYSLATSLPNDTFEQFASAETLINQVRQQGYQQGLQQGLQLAMGDTGQFQVAPIPGQRLEVLVQQSPGITDPAFGTGQQLPAQRTGFASLAQDRQISPQHKNKNRITKRKVLRKSSLFSSYPRLANISRDQVYQCVLLIAEQRGKLPQFRSSNKGYQVADLRELSQHLMDEPDHSLTGTTPSVVSTSTGFSPFRHTTEETAPLPSDNDIASRYRGYQNEYRRAKEKKSRGSKFRCSSGCDWSNEVKANWERHERRHYPQEIYLCRSCIEQPLKKRVFFRQDLLCRHLKKRHLIQRHEEAINEIERQRCKIHVRGSLFPRECFFESCDQRFEIFDERLKHIAEHFERAEIDSTRAITRNRFPPSDDDDDDDDAAENDHGDESSEEDLFYEDDDDDLDNQKPGPSGAGGGGPGPSTASASKLAGSWAPDPDQILYSSDIDSANLNSFCAAAKTFVMNNLCEQRPWKAPSALRLVFLPHSVTLGIPKTPKILKHVQLQAALYLEVEEVRRSQVLRIIRRELEMMDNCIEQSSKKIRQLARSQMHSTPSLHDMTLDNVRSGIEALRLDPVCHSTKKLPGSRPEERHSSSVPREGFSHDAVPNRRDRSRSSSGGEAKPPMHKRSLTPADFQPLHKGSRPEAIIKCLPQTPRRACLPKHLHHDARRWVGYSDKVPWMGMRMELDWLEYFLVDGRDIHQVQKGNGYKRRVSRMVAYLNQWDGMVRNFDSGRTFDISEPYASS